MSPQRSVRHTPGFPEEFKKVMIQQLGNESQHLFEALNQKPPVSIRFNLSKRIEGNTQTQNEIVEWSESAVYLDKRPKFTLDPHHHAGVYYVQEAASMFVSYALKQYINKEGAKLRILDLCAAPGGKSTLLSELGKNNLIVSNELIRSRYAILRENLLKWGGLNYITTSQDPSSFSKLKAFFDIILIDAPCSGEGMFRKDRDARSEWSLGLVELCQKRQRRIISDVYEALKPGGLLLYCTCTLNRQENEDNIRWMQDNFKLKSVAIESEPDWGIKQSDVSDIYAYRFYPHLTRSEGFFISLLVRDGTPGGDASKVRKRNKNPDTLKLASKKMRSSLENYFLVSSNHHILEDQNGLYRLISEHILEDVQQLSQKLNKIHCGMPVGAFKRDSFIPHHGLAMAVDCDLHFPELSVDLETALRFLKKESLPIESQEKVWQILTFQGIKLGWVKAVTGRLNNYYPKEYRIKMHLDHA